MDNIKKKIFDISVIGISDILASAIAAVFWLYMASILGPENYGHLSYLLSIAALASGLSLFGSNYTLLVFSAKKIEIQATLYVISLAAGIISSIIVFLFFLNIGTSFLILGYIIFGLVTADLLGKKLYKKYSKYVLIQKILLVILGIGLYYLVGEVGIFIGIGLSHIPLVVEIIKGFKKSKINLTILKEKKNVIFNNFIVSISGAVHSSIDTLIIAPLLGFTILGNYSLSLQFFALISLLPTIVMKYLVPQDSTGIENKKLKKLVVLVSIGFAILGSTIGPFVISSVFPKFIEGGDLIRIISWAIIPNTITNVMFYSKFWAKELNQKIVISSLTMVSIQVLGIILLGPIYGAVGIAFAFVITAISGTISSMLLDRYLKPLN